MNPNKQSTTFNYYFNITDKMKNFIKNSMLKNKKGNQK